ncbi:MAG: geranylgeranyl reductase family protein [Actinobacteria bacterium]|nr:MAG: geranylgeranyl reductase family protein [Actinomycetota bacterium]
MERFDVAVVGAGPAGSIVAYGVSRAGARVLLIDKARFPRDKPCGGGLTLRAVKELPFPVDPVVEDIVTRVTCRLRYGRAFEREGRTALCLMTQRRRLDHYLVERAQEAGAQFRDGARVQVESDTRLTVDGTTIEVESLVGADGANGVTARTLGLGGEIVPGVALEGNVPYGVVERETYRGRMVIELAILPGGYGWIFPKGDHINVGVGGWASEGPELRPRLRELCLVYGVDADAVTDLRGHRLPLRRPGTKLARGRALLVGDAAGLVDPVSGDGVYEALVSARLAVEAITSGALESYEPALRATLDPIAAAGWGAKVALDRFPRAVFAVMRLPVTWRALEKVVTGEVHDPASTRGVERRAMKLIEVLARRAGDPGRAYRTASAV